MEFIRTRSCTDYIISIVLFVGGIVLIAIPTSTAVNIVGTLLAITAVILILVMKTGFRNSDSKEMFHRKTYYFPASRKSEIIDSLEKTPEKVEIEHECTNNGLMVEFYYNSKCPKVFAQVYEYVPYKYETCSELIAMDKAKADKFI